MAFLTAKILWYIIHCDEIPALLAKAWNYLYAKSVLKKDLINLNNLRAGTHNTQQYKSLNRLKLLSFLPSNVLNATETVSMHLKPVLIQYG